MSDVPTPSRPTEPLSALARMGEGNARFVAGDLTNQRRDVDHRASLAGGQHPYAAVLGCADSRVPHEILFDEGLGDFFSVRVAGNSARDPLVIGSLEFAVVQLGVSAIVVLGHEDCGAVKAAIDVARFGTKLPGAVPSVVEPIVPVVESVLRTIPHGTTDSDLLDACVRANVAHTMERLSHVEILSHAVNAGRLAIAGREYRLASGEAIPVS